MQTALGGLNNGAIQTMVDADGVHFTYTVTDDLPRHRGVPGRTAETRTQHQDHQDHDLRPWTRLSTDDARKVKGQKQWTGFDLIRPRHRVEHHQRHRPERGPT